jgi:hypothetical protein
MLLTAMLGIMMAVGCVVAQEQPAPAAGSEISGVVQSGGMPLPGVTVSATESQSGQQFVTSTGVDGSYSIHVPGDGTYEVRAEMAAFTAAARQVTITAEQRSARLDLELVLLSRAQPASTPQMPVAAAPRRRPQNQPRLQSGSGETTGFSAAEQSVPAGLQVPGMSAESATESVAVSGNTATGGWGNLSSEEMRQRAQEMRDREGRGYEPGGPGGLGGPGGGPSGGRGGGGGFGGGPMIFMGGRGRFNFNRPHGTVYYSGGDSVLDAAPYSLTGVPQPKPSYQQNRFGASIGGPLTIPRLYNGGQKTFFFANYNGARAQSPYDAFSTVPTIDQRQACTTPPTTTACALLQYIPEPNQPAGSRLNYHRITSLTSNSDDLNVRLIRALGSSTLGPQRRGTGGRNNINVGFHYHSSGTQLGNPFETVGGTTSVRSFDVPIGYVRSFGKLTNNLRFDYNRNRISTQNLYAFVTNVAGGNFTQGGAEIAHVSSNAFDWGIPNLTITGFTPLNDINPVSRRDQTFTISDSMIWTHGKHTWRWGGDFRRIQINTETSSNPRGSYNFTGINTGTAFGDFLAGLPQLSSVQYGANNDDSYHFRGNSWDLFAQDEWRVRGNLTLNLGLRYEYVSPYSEINNRIANLLVANLSSQNPTVAIILPGVPGFPATLVHPDRNNFAPRLGIAWKPTGKTVVRAGYGINYNTGALAAIVQQLAFQPPFSFTQTNRTCSSPTDTNCLPPGQIGFNFSTIPSGMVTNIYGVDPNYRLGYVQIWNLNIQRELPADVILNVDYTGTKGTRLDILEAPNRTASGLFNNNLPPFNFELSQGNSIAHAGTVRLRKRLRHGVSIGGSYTYSKSIDDASTIGGGAVVVAQNAADLAAERSLSSFDQRHRFVADYLVELPFGHDKRWLSSKSIARDLLGDWQWSGDWTIASGTPFSPRVLGGFGEVSSGTNGTLRPDLTGQPIGVANPTVTEWFNTAAFTLPAPGKFGNAGRNSIIGPGSRVFNMAFTKVIPLGDVRMLEFRTQITNIFNTPQYTAIDTVINSPSFGQVVSVGSMRRIQAQARFRF